MKSSEVDKTEVSVEKLEETRAELLKTIEWLDEKINEKNRATVKNLQ